VQEASDAFHNFAHATITFLIFDRHQFNRLRERFVPLGESFQPFIDSHSFDTCLPVRAKLIITSLA
jgi:hypothetical protein